MKKFIYIVIVIFSLIYTDAKAQWVQTSGATGSNIQCFTVKNTDIFAGYNNGINSGGVIRSTDYGARLDEC